MANGSAAEGGNGQAATPVANMGLHMACTEQHFRKQG